MRNVPTPVPPIPSPTGPEAASNPQADAEDTACTTCAGRTGEGRGTLAMLVTMIAVGLGLALFIDIADGLRFLIMLALGITAAVTTSALIRRRARRATIQP